MRRTILLSQSKQDIYEKMFRWFSLQGYGIENQIHNERMLIRIIPITAIWFWAIAIILACGYIVPAIPWLYFARGKIVITLEDCPKEGVYLVADISGPKAHQVFNHLIGVLSMLPRS